MLPLIKTEDLSVIYDLGKSSETVALDKVNIEIYPKEYIIFFGPSGCGKSTLLYSIAGLQKPTHGKIFLKDREIASLSKRDFMAYQRRFTGMIFQAYYLISSLTVLDNVILPQMLEGIPRKEREVRARSMLERFKIENQAKRFPNALSGGQQQRVAISRALINNPVLILADEPVGNLDSTAAENVMGLLKELNEKDGKTIVLVTHDPRYLSYAHRIYHMEDGKITQEIVNPEKVYVGGDISKKPRPPTQLERLSHIYPYLPKSKLQAKALTFHIHPPLSFESQERFEQILEMYIKHKIAVEEFYRLLDAPHEKGGAGLYKQSALKYARHIEAILKEADKLRAVLFEKPAPPKPEIETRVESLRRYMLDRYKGKLTRMQIHRLEKLIEGRILGRIDKKTFMNNVDAPLKKNGVGLNKRTAKNFTRMLEIILAEAK